MKKLLVLVAILYTGVLVGTATQEREPWIVPEEERAVENPLTSSDDLLEEGAELYRKNCLMCHGETGKGDGPATARIKPAPPDLTPQAARERMTDGEIFYKITVGKRPMRGMERKLSEDERWSLVIFVRSLQGD